MAHLQYALLIFLIILNFFLLGSGRLTMCIRVAAWQGFALAGLALVVELQHGIGQLWRIALLVTATAFVKGILLPRGLNRAVEKAAIRREVEPILGYSTSILLGMAALGIAFRLGVKLPLPQHVTAMGVINLPIPSLPISTAFFCIFTGLVLLITRRKALTQTLGYLVMESGIFVLGVSYTQSPLFVELGVLLDVFVAVFIMGVIIFQISRTFDHIDTDRLSALKEFPHT